MNAFFFFFFSDTFICCFFSVYEYHPGRRFRRRDFNRRRTRHYLQTDVWTRKTERIGKEKNILFFFSISLSPIHQDACVRVRRVRDARIAFGGRVGGVSSVPRAFSISGGTPSRRKKKNGSSAIIIQWRERIGSSNYKTPITLQVNVRLDFL